KEPAIPVHANDRRVAGFAREAGVLSDTYHRKRTDVLPGIVRRGISRLLVETLRTVVNGICTSTSLRRAGIDRSIRIEVPPAAPRRSGPGRITGSGHGDAVGQHTAIHASAACKDLVDR